MSFELSQKSLSRLAGVDERLINCVKFAIQITPIDFGVVEGLRTLETQKKYVEAGKSQTMTSKHLQGKAVDLMAYINGAVSWELNLYDDIAEAMKEAAIQHNLPLRWGAAWNIPDIRLWRGSMAAAMNYYIDERRRSSRRPFIDAPHFEISD